MQTMVNEILTRNGINEPEQFFDKVFLLGEWYRDTRRNVKMCRITGLARFHEQVTGHPFVDELPTVAELRTGKRFPEMLISVHALALININGEIFVPLLQRDLKAKFDPGSWTLPAGRMDQSSFTLGALTEFLEEIRMIYDGRHILPRHFCIDAEEVIELFHKSWDTISLYHAASHAHIKKYEMMMLDLLPLPGQQEIQIIRKDLLSEHNEDLMSRADKGLVVVDGRNNTTEVVVPLRLKLPGTPEIFDGEEFGRKAELFPLTTILEKGWLEQNPTVPTLKRLISQHADLLKHLANG